MTLPINTHLNYNLVIPSTQKKIKFRPFIVREKKELMIAHQSEDADVMIDTLKSVIKSCVIGEIDVDKLAIFDLEYLFINIRAKSDGEDTELIFGCDTETCVDDPKARIKIKFDLTKIDVQYPENFSQTVPLFGDVGVQLKFPSFDVLKQIEAADSDSEIMFKIIIDSIDTIYDKENVYTKENYTTEELVEFIDNLDTGSLNKIIEFFMNMPKLSVPVKYNCPVCKKEHSFDLKGINNFF